MALSATLTRRLGLARFLTGEGVQAGPILLHRRRVFILPTGAGYGFVGLLLLLLLGSINYGNSLGFILTFMLAGMAWSGMHHTYRNLLRLRVDRGRPEPAFAGGTARFRLEIDNPDGPPRHALQLRAADGGHAALDVDRHGSVLLERAAERRGWLDLGRVTIATRYPLGLFRAWAHVELEQRCLVYPRPAPPAAPPPPAPSQADRTGDQGRGVDDFSGFRGYHPGDPPRHVYWKGLARSDVWLTKQFGGDRVEQLWLDWASAPETDVEARLGRLCRWVLDAEAAGHAYGLRLPGREIAPGRGEIHFHRCLAALALYGEADREPGAG